MSLAKNVIIITEFLLVFGDLVQSTPNWNYEIVAIENENGTPDVVTSELVRIRVSRGVYSISGIVNIKRDLTDDCHIKIDLFYSPTGNHNYVKSPFHVPEMTLTDFGNTIYKDMLMNSVAKCAENAPNFKNKFVAPLTKRVITANQCLASNENMPSVAKSGYYKIVFKCSNQANLTVTLIVNIEQK